jgi:hypothetical protein
MYGIEMRPTFGRQIFALQSFTFCKNSNANLFVPLTLVALCLSSLGVSGCGGVVTLGGSSRPTTNDVNLSAAPSSIEFGSVSPGNSANQKVSVTNKGSDSVQISQLSLSNAAFRVDGEGKLPATLAVGSTLSFNVQFHPNDSTDATGQLNVITSASTTPAATVPLHGKGSAQNAEMSALSCDTAEMTAVGSDTCTILTNNSAPSGGLLVRLSSSIAAIKVPASVTVPEGATSVKFAATVATLSTDQSGTITATQGSIEKSFSISLSSSGAVAPPPALDALSCANTSFSAAGNTICTVALSAASSKAVIIALASSSTAITVPESVTVAAHSTTASFAAKVAAVSRAQSVAISATANSSSKSLAIQLKASKASAAGLSLSTSAMQFGNIEVGTSAQKSVTLTSSGSAPVTIKSDTITGSGFSVSGGSFPATLDPGKGMILTLRFGPSAAGSVSGQLTVSSNAGTATLGLSGTGTKPAPTISALSCSTTSITGSLSDPCTVSLSGSAPNGGVSIALASSSGAVTAPGAITVPAGSSTASFTANVTAVTKAQAATISATANASSKSIALQLKPSAASLSLSTSSLAFGSVSVGTAATKSVILTSTGTVPVTIKSKAITGTGFSMSGGSFPATLKPGQAIVLTVQFNPSTTASVSGQLSILSDVAAETVALSGTGTNAAPTISALSCATTSITGSLADSCKVSLSGSAPSGGVTIALASSSTAVTAPGAITVPAGSTTASFTANVAAVSKAQTATISATANASSKSIALQLKPSAAALSLSTSSLAFGSVSVGTAVSKSVTLTSTGTAPVTIKSNTITGTGFSVSGGSFPATLKPGQAMVLTVQFNPSTTASVSGQLSILSDVAAETVALSGTGTNAAPTISALSCATTSITGSLADSCKVSLSGSAPKGGLTVALASSSTNLTVPGSVTIPATATTAAFTANAIAVSTTQSVKLTATTGGTSKSVSLQLIPALAQLSVNATTISFGAVVVNHATTQVVTLTSTGKAAVTVKSISVKGTGFSLSPVSVPATLNPGQTLLLTLTFDPTTTGSQTGQLTITSDSSTNSTVTIALSGSSNPHQVELSWNAPSVSSTPISQYRVYRANGGTGSFAKLSTVAQTTYTDTSVQSGQSYSYYVTSVSSSGAESTPSKTTTVTIP